MIRTTLCIFILALCCTACGGNNSSTSATGSDSGSSSNASTATANANAHNGISKEDYDKGLALIAKNDCLTCHKVDDKLVGPSYRDVANKYTANPATIDSLSNKIIHGGAGNWGQVAMTPHPNLSKADAEQMVKYVLYLKQ